MKTYTFTGTRKEAEAHAATLPERKGYIWGWRPATAQKWPHDDEVITWHIRTFKQ